MNNPLKAHISSAASLGSAEPSFKVPIDSAWRERSADETDKLSPSSVLDLVRALYVRCQFLDGCQCLHVFDFERQLIASEKRPCSVVGR